MAFNVRKMALKFLEVTAPSLLYAVSDTFTFVLEQGFEEHVGVSCGFLHQ